MTFSNEDNDIHTNLTLLRERSTRRPINGWIQRASAGCCQRELHCIGADRSERLDIVPAQFRVLVTVRPKYACRKREDCVRQAAAPVWLIDGGLPTDATVAQVLVSKYADQLPLYRQAQIYARQGIDLDRSTPADWVGPVNLSGHALRVSHTYAQPLAKLCSNSSNLLLGHRAEYPP
jgi:transposase